MDSYDRVAKVVEPKKIALAAAEEEYNKIMAALKVKQDELDAIMAALAALEQQLEDSINEKKRLEDEVTLCEVKLERARNSSTGLVASATTGKCARLNSARRTRTSPGTC